MDVIPSLGSRFIASCARWAGNGGLVWIKTRCYAISGMTINTAQDGGLYHCGEICVNDGTSNAGDKIRIVRAVGYR